MFVAGLKYTTKNTLKVFKIVTFLFDYFIYETVRT